MSRNRIFDEYLENEYNKEEIYNSIYSKITKQNNLKKYILNIVATLFIVVIIGTTTSTIYAKKNWDEEYKEYKDRYITCVNSTIDIEPENVNAKNLDMDYVYNDKIGIKLDSLFLTEHNCLIDVDLQIQDESKKEYNAFEFSFAIYDEENNIYIVSERPKFGAEEGKNYKKKLCRELGLKYDSSNGIPKMLVNQFALNPIFSEKENNIMRIDLKSANGFPKSKKIYVRVFDIGYTLKNERIIGNNVDIIDSENFTLSDYEWQFEIEIPSQFYDRTYTNLIPIENIEKIEFNRVILSSEAILSMIINTEYSIVNILNGVYISDEEGNIYTPSIAEASTEIQLLFNLSTSSTNQKLYLNLDIQEDNIKKKIELIKD